MNLIKAIIIVFLLSTSAFAFQGKVVKVTDGDTVQVLNSQNQLTKVRLYGIDCPEKSQAFGQKAKEFVLSQVGGKAVDVEAIDIDKYGRTVGVITFGGKNLNSEILKAGFAWYYAQYCKAAFCSEWQGSEQTAKSSKIGLWSDPHAQPPWDYRHGGSSSVSTDKQPEQTVSDADSSGQYHGNVDSLKFHNSSCKHYNCKNCTRVFKSKAEAEKAGYVPCKICKP